MTNPTAAVMTTDGASTYTGLAASTLEKLRLTGDGPMFLKLGRSVRYRPSDLDNWMAARAVTSTSQSVS